MSSTNVPSEGQQVRKPINVNFWKYWTGQTISQLGSSVTLFALPLMVYKLTGSALNLGIMTATEFVPYLLFGLLIGAVMDRVNRKRMMIYVDLGRTILIGSIPLMAFMGHLSIWWVYGVGFLTSTLNICFDTGQFAAIPIWSIRTIWWPPTGASRPAIRRRACSDQFWRACWWPLCRSRG